MKAVLFPTLEYDNWKRNASTKMKWAERNINGTVRPKHVLSLVDHSNKEPVRKHKSVRVVSVQTYFISHTRVWQMET